MATRPAATATAAPPDDPPGVNDGSQGLRAGKRSSGALSSARPKGGVAVRPNGISPAWRKAEKRWLSCMGRTACERSAAAPAAGGRPLAAAPRSFARKGTPWNGARLPAATASASAAFASARANAASRKTTAPNPAWVWQAVRLASITARALMRPSEMAAARAVASGMAQRPLGRLIVVDGNVPLARLDRCLLGQHHRNRFGWHFIGHID